MGKEVEVERIERKIEMEVLAGVNHNQDIHNPVLDHMASSHDRIPAHHVETFDGEGESNLVP